jgi:hypothetical protein
MKNRDRLFMAGGVERSQLGETAGLIESRIGASRGASATKSPWKST